MNRRPLHCFVLTWCTLAVLAIAQSNVSRAAEPRPNFLFIAIDDLKPLLGHLGEEPNNFLSEIYPDPAERAAVRRVLSPNMDRLAAQGIGFRHAYCPAPLCNPSRTATLTGIAPHHSGVYANQEQFRQSERPFLRDAVTLPQNLRNRGYYTAGAGKIFHTGSVQLDADGKITKDWPDSAHSWDVWVNGTADGADRGRTTTSPWSLDDNLFRFGVTSTATTAMDDYVKADLIARVLEKGSVTVHDSKVKQEKTITLPKDRPWFLACGIFRPHLPFVVPQEFLELFPADAIRIDRAFYDRVVADTRDLAPGGLRFTESPRDDGEPGKGRFSDMLRQGKAREKDGDLKAWREMVRHYLASVAFADRCVGRLFDALDRSPHAANTVVVLWSDHGWDLGTKFRAGKVALWESTTNCVLIIRDPLTPAALRGKPSYARVSLQDLYPTVAARAGATKPAYVAGRDLTPLLRDPTLAWDEIPLTTQGARNHALRDAGYRYIRYADDVKNAELYDERADPREFTNRIADPALKPIRDSLNARLDQRIASGPFPYDTGKPGTDSTDDEDSPARRRPANSKKSGK